MFNFKKSGLFPPSSPMPQNPTQAPLSAPTVFKFKETAAYEKGFEVYFEDKIKPVLKELDGIRIAKMEQLEKNKPIANLIFWGGVILGLISTYFSGSIGGLIVIVIIVWAIKSYMLSSPGATLATEFKNRVIPLTIKFFGDYQYLASKELDESILRNSGIFESFNRTEAEDFISGVMNGINFAFSELDLSYHSGKHTHTVFEGKIFMLEMNQSMNNGKIIIKREGEKGLWTWLTGKNHGLKNLKLDNAEFEGIFEVYSSDEMQAKSILTPELMQKLIRLNSQYPQGALRGSYFDNHLILALSSSSMTGGMFETDNSKKLVLDTEELHKFLAEFHSILQVIETIVPGPREL